jgi:putative membrane protein
MEAQPKEQGIWNKPAGFSSNRWLQGMIAVYAVFWICMAVSPYDRFDWVLENLLIWLTLMVLLLTYRWFAFDNLSYLLLGIFLSLHTLGAHSSYAVAPLDEVMRAAFGFQRNNYDRIVHFCFGLLLAYPIREFAVRVMQIKGRWSYVHPVVIVLASGAFYELIEMWVAQIVAPDIGAVFLGSQGDPWDAQHDMEVALYGAMIAMLITYMFKKRSEPSNLKVHAHHS